MPVLCSHLDESEEDLSSSSVLMVSGQLCTEDKTTKKSNVSTLQTIFQSGATRLESTQREREAEREISREES